MRSLACAVGGLACLACQIAPDPSCPVDTELAAQLYGPVAARGRLRFDKGSTRLDGSTVTPVRATLELAPEGESLVLMGIATCRAGIVRARLTPGAARAERGPNVLAAAFEVIHRPSLVAGELVGGFSVQLENPSEPGLLELSGFVGEAMPAAATADPTEVVSESSTGDPGEPGSQHSHGGTVAEGTP
jgi:hypothetical protein